MDTCNNVLILSMKMHILLVVLIDKIETIGNYSNVATELLINTFQNFNMMMLNIQGQLTRQVRRTMYIISIELGFLRISILSRNVRVTFTPSSSESTTSFKSSS
ncbi:unnamed protein product [Schistosoma rodhaini]|nr:unnamed protein product [Schistosoma rodhaini]